MKMLSSVRSRILLGLILPLLIMALGVASIAVWKMQKTATHDFTAKVDQELSLFDHYVSRLLSSALNNAAALTEAPALKGSFGQFRTFKNETIDQAYHHVDLPEAAREALAPLMAMSKTHDDYAEVFVGYTDGAYATSIDNTPIKAGTDMSTRGWYLSCLQSSKEGLVVDAYLSITNQMVVSVAHKLRDTAGTVVGVLGIDLELSTLSTMVDQMRMGETGHFILLEKTGRVLCSPRNKGQVGKILGKDLRDETLESLLKSPDGLYEMTLNGVPVLVSTRSNEYGWKLLFVESVSEIYAAVDVAVRDISIFVVSLVLIMLAVAILLARSIIRPLGQLVKYAHEVATGNLETVVDKKHFYGELAQLHAALTEMLGNLKKFISRATQQAEEAQKATESARQATAQAEESARHAENAKREGMLAAAGQLESVVGVLSSASGELSSQIRQSDHSAQESAQFLGEAATAMNQMNATVQEVAHSASTASHMSATTQEQALTGAEIVRHSLVSVNNAHQVSLTLREDMNELNRHAQGINQIMTVISDIADQTNLLALNAAIEAARAGDAGRGFAVVADEVRKLAEKTMASTQDVGNAIRSIQHSTDKSMASMDSAVGQIEETAKYATQAGQALSAIVTDAGTTADQVNAIAAACEEQSAASEEINQSIVRVNTMSTRTAEAMNEAAKAVAELVVQAQNLSELIDEMKKG